jgi:carbon-monoxide dehydrogenase medium subunit
MIPAAFEYVRPASLDEALRTLARDPEAKLLAGGQSLLPLLKLRVARCTTLVDIGRLPELAGVRQRPDGGLTVGAATTYAELMASPAMNLALLADALPGIADLPACLIALGAGIVARSSSGERVIPAEGFFRGAFESDLQPGEIVTEVRLPAPRGDVGSAYRVLEQPASGYALVGVAVVVGREGGGPISFARVGVTGVGDVAYRAGAVEAALLGSDGSGGAIKAAAAHVADGHRVRSDIHADATYRAAVAAVYAERAITAALARLG